MTPQAPGNSGGVDYTPLQNGNRYTPSYTPQTATPFLQSIMSQHGSSPLQQSNSLGLPSLQSMFNMPQRGSPIQPTGIQQLAPMAPYTGSTYRPDMSGIAAQLRNVAPAVKPEQIAALNNDGTPVNPFFEAMSDGLGGG